MTQNLRAHSLTRPFYIQLAESMPIGLDRADFSDSKFIAVTNARSSCIDLRPAQ